MVYVHPFGYKHYRTNNFYIKLGIKMDTLYSEIKGNIKIEVNVDEHPFNPRENYNLGKMVCFHKRYNLGDEHDYRHEDYNSWSEMKKAIIKEEDVVAIFPLYLYDHSGITMSTSPFSCAWDSGQIGWIYATRKNVREHYRVKRVTKQIIEKVERVILAEVKEYNAFLTGEIYECCVYKIDVCDKGHEHLTLEHAVGGYINLDYCIEEAKSYL